MSSSELDAFREQWLAEVRQRSGNSLAPVDNTDDRPSERPSLGPRLQNALDYYRLAVDYEQQSKLDHALALYRKAFRLDPHVDRLYHRHTLADDRLAQRIEHETPAPSSSTPQDVSFESAPISTIVEQLHQHEPLVFAPEDDKRPLPIASIPDELLVHTLLRLALQGDITSVERFAQVNRKLRLLTLDSTIWR